MGCYFIRGLQTFMIIFYCCIPLALMWTLKVIHTLTTHVPEKDMETIAKEKEEARKMDAQWHDYSSL